MDNHIQTDPMLNEHEVAKILNLKVSTLRRWRWQQKGPRFAKFGAAVRYRRSDVERYIEAQTQSLIGPGI